MNKLAKWLLYASFLGTFAEGMLSPIYAVFTEKIGGSMVDAGMGYAVFSIATGIAVMLIGKTDFFDRHSKWFLFWGFLCAGLCDLLYIGVSNKWEFFAVQVILGVSLGIANPAWDALYCDDEEDGKSSAGKWSFWTGGISFVCGLSALFGSLLVKYFGFNTMFVLMFLFDLISVSYCYRIARRTDG
jgi:hypothetical protein